MKVFKPILDYLGLGTETAEGACAAPGGRSTAERRRPTSSPLFLFLCLVLSFSLGWRQRGESVPQFAERPVETARDVLLELRHAGIECDEQLDYSERPSGVLAICRGTPRFDLHVSPSVEEAYESFDLASLLGCFTVGNLPHKQFFLARENNWNLLTHDKALADDIARLHGVTVTVGACDVPRGRMAV